jgi:hypothetical protein
MIDTFTVPTICRTKLERGQSKQDFVVGQYVKFRGFFSKNVQTGSVAHPVSYSIGTGLFRGVKQPGHEVDHSPQSSVKVKSKWRYTSTPPVLFHGVDRNNDVTQSELLEIY